MGIDKVEQNAENINTWLDTNGKLISLDQLDLVIGLDNLDGAIEELEGGTKYKAELERISVDLSVFLRHKMYDNFKVTINNMAAYIKIINLVI